MNSQILCSSIKILKKEFDYQVFEIAPKNYKPLTKKEIDHHKKIIDALRVKIWDKSFWGLSISDSICAIACDVDGSVKRLNKHFKIY